MKTPAGKRSLKNSRGSLRVPLCRLVGGLSRDFGGRTGKGGKSIWVETAQVLLGHFRRILETAYFFLGKFREMQYPLFGARERGRVGQGF